MIKTQLNLYIDSETIDRFRKICRSKRIEMSNKVERWMQEFIRIQDGLYKPEDDGPIIRICPNCKRNLRQKHLEEYPRNCLYCEHPLEARP